MGANLYSTFDTTLQTCTTVLFLKTVFKCCFKQFLNYRGYCQEYKLLYVCNVQLSGAAFYIKVNTDLVLLKPPKLSHLSNFKNSHHKVFLASFVLYLLHVKFVK